MTAATLQREFHTFSRNIEYFDPVELQAQTSQPPELFPVVLVKELLDNAIDAVEETKKVPTIKLVVNATEDLYEIKVKDNGNGISKYVLGRILDFDIRGSSKIFYNTPTRGQMGNALKCVFGVPVALSERRQYEQPIIIETQGVMHEISIKVDATNEIFIHDEQESGSTTEGTAISVTIPNKKDVIAEIRKIFIAYGVFNPHANLNAVINGEEISYEAIVTEKWRKFNSCDLPSIHWFNVPEFEKFVNASAKTNNKPFGTFIRQFKGLSSAKKAKEIANKFPRCKYISDIDREKIHNLLLDSMKEQTQPPASDILGIIGKEVLESRLQELRDIDKTWYKKKTAFYTKDGREIPFVIEAILGINHTTDDVSVPIVITGLNFSPVYSDPFKNTTFYSEDFYSTGLRSLIRDLKINMHDNAIFILHLTSPVLEFVARDKSTLTFESNAEMRTEIQNVVYGCCKELYEKRLKEHRNDVRAQQKEAREHERHEKEYEKAHNWTLKDAVFHVIDEAIHKTTSGGRFRPENRQILYQTRPLIAPYTNKELSDTYLSQLLEEYQEIHGEIDIIYQPRGDFYEPHTGVKVPLGTKDVDEYPIPEYVYNKILYIEKRGFMSLFEDVKLGERYDLAVAASVGYAVSACRKLLARASKEQKTTILCLHDCDKDGLMIGESLKESLKEFNVEIIDLGLFVNEVLELQAENVTHKKRPAARLKEILPDSEYQFILDEESERVVGRNKNGTPKKQWQGKRVELNALTPEELINFIEKKLEQYNLTAKVCPPDTIIGEEASSVCDRMLEDDIINEITKSLDIKSIVSEIKGVLIDKIDLSDIPEELKAKLVNNPVEAWKDIVSQKVEKAVSGVVRDHDDLVEDEIYKNHKKVEDCKN